MFRTIVVDDERMALVATDHSFPWANYGFFVAEKTTDPQTALALLRKQHFDAAFIDIRMPGLSGLELVRLCREEGSTTEFVVISGYTDFAYMKQAVQLGAFDYCQKPVQTNEAEQLLGKLRERLGRNRLANDPARLERQSSGQPLRQLLALYGLETDDSPCAVAAVKHPDPVSLLHTPFYRENDAVFLLPDGVALFLFPVESSEIDRVYERCAAAPGCRIAFGVLDSDSTQLARMAERLKAELLLTSEERPIVRTWMTEPDEAFSDLLGYVEAHFAEELSLRLLAEQFSLNYTYCSELFKSATGVNFSKYLTNLRMKAACELLATTGVSVAEICQRAGYNSFHHFAGVFKRCFGMTPTEYRQKKERER